MRQEKLRASGLTITTTAAAARRLAARMGLPATWAVQIVASRSGMGQTFGARLTRRFGAVTSASTRAAAFAERYTLEPIKADTTDMTIAPFAPPLRQISAARQGAAQWQTGKHPAREPRLPPWARAGANGSAPPTPKAATLLDELTALGWGQPKIEG